MKRAIFLAAYFLWVNINCMSATIRVPQDYTTIQSAIDAASEGDEVVVSPGTYVQSNSINVIKKITLRSTFDGSDWNLVKSTVVKFDGGPAIISNQSSGSVYRGLTLTRDPISITPGISYNKLGIEGGGNTTIEYCIIENCVSVGGTGAPWLHYGAAIKYVGGVIQNNIIRNNVADGGCALGDCTGIIKNNLIYNTNKYPVGVYLTGSPKFINNTVYSSTTLGCEFNFVTTAMNNIMWQKGAGSAYYHGSAPQNSVIKNYSGLGSGIITSDPKFVDPDHGDFRLQDSSPCIDAGLTTATIKADINGVQRGLKGVSQVRGDGSCVDIGAYEYKPKPVSVWLPNGGPDAIDEGDSLKVAWELDVPPAGTAINLQLFNGYTRIADFGFFWNANGATESTIRLPAHIPTRTTYTIRGVSVWNPTLYFDSPLMTIFGKNVVPWGEWNMYM